MHPQILRKCPENREPTEAERGAAVLASAALIATQRLGTARRHESKRYQEQQIEDALRAELGSQLYGFQACFRRRTPGVLGLRQGMDCSCRDLSEAHSRDHRITPLECKVSNSYLNSVERLNNDAAAKAEVWRKDFGETQIVPTAIISGVYKLHKLEEAQQRGLTIFWAHSLLLL